MEYYCKVCIPIHLYRTYVSLRSVRYPVKRRRSNSSTNGAKTLLCSCMYVYQTKKSHRASIKSMYVLLRSASIMEML